MLVETTFYKFHGAGNDFIMIDNRESRFNLSVEQVKSLCNRRLGIGADGLILLEDSLDAHTDFKMRYYNADGFEASLCGNGSRCVVAFAHYLKIINSQTRFNAFDGEHFAEIIHHQQYTWQIALSMQDLSQITVFSDGMFLDTGSPHFVVFCDSFQNIDIQKDGKQLRYDARFQGGSNIDFCMPYQDGIFVRTYERGVEDETLSCGTGVTATAIAWAKKEQLKNGEHSFNIYTQGGKFAVSFTIIDNLFSSICLKGPATLAFTGKIKQI